MFSRIRLILLSIAILLGSGTAALPQSVGAQSLGILPACTEVGDCGLCDFVDLFINFTELILSLVGLIAVLLFIIGGIFYIISGGNPERAKRGKQIIVGTVIGSIIVMGAWLIVNFSIAALVGADLNDVTIFPVLSDEGTPTGGGDEWWEIACDPVYQDCSGGADVDGQRCETAECDLNCLCQASSGSCVSACEYLAASYDSAECIPETSCTIPPHTIIPDKCPSDNGEPEVCCAQL